MSSMARMMCVWFRTSGNLPNLSMCGVTCGVSMWCMCASIGMDRVRVQAFTLQASHHDSSDVCCSI